MLIHKLAVVWGFPSWSVQAAITKYSGLAPPLLSSTFILGHSHCLWCLSTQASASGTPGLSFGIQHVWCGLGNFFNLSESHLSHLCKGENNSNLLTCEDLWRADMDSTRQRASTPQLLDVRITSFDLVFGIFF